MKSINNRYLAFILFVMLWTIVSPTMAADEGHTLNVIAKPSIAGSFNTKNASLQENETIHLYAYSNSNFSFKEWQDEHGAVISSAQDFVFTMPDKDVTLSAIYEYNPMNPENPRKNYWDSNTGSAIVDDFNAGELSTAISNAIKGSKATDLVSLIVAGKMTNNDYNVINSYANCIILDISRVTGVTEIPSYAFDYTNLESVYIPATIEKIGSRAFYQCKQLSSLTVYAMVPPTIESNVFTGIQEGLVVYVPAAAIAQYQDAAGWKDFTILPIQEDIRSLSVSLPEGAKTSDYSQMWLELTNTRSGQKMHYVMTDRTTYTFANIIRNTSWNAVLRNQRGDVFGKIEDIDVKDEDVSVTFSALSTPKNVSLSVKTPDGNDVTSRILVTWIDANGNYIAQSTGLSGLISGYALSYKVALPQDLAMQYNTPEQTDYVVSDASNALTLTLVPIKQVTISGCVKDVATKIAMNGATVTASQTFGGKYSKTVSTKTDAKGNYSLSISNVPTALAVSASDYISQSIVCDSLMTGEDISMSDISLKGISGAVISLNLTYTKCPTEDGDEDTFLEWYADYNNVSYSIYNKTKHKSVNQFNVQYPQIVLLEDVDEGDVLEMTATSKTNAFLPVNATATINEEQRANAAFNIVELGKIKASFAKNSNAAVVGTLYDANGKLVKSYDYNNASLTINDLTDGTYTLVTMGSSKLFNSIYDLSQLPQTGLTLGADYAQSSVEVHSGNVCVIEIAEVPTLNESKLYYTGDNTSFTVNKSSIVAGNYLTLTGHLDFKSAYATKVSNVNLIVDIPETCQFVENSVMVGSSTSSYTIQNNRITIPMARYTDRVRFCIIPTLGGDYAPSALAQFDIEGETITQPIGSANYTAKDLSINVPSTVAKTTIPVSGTAIGACDIEIYDGDVMIGQTRSLANGTWAATCELSQAYNLSTHCIYAKVMTKAGVKLQSEIKSCSYDKNAIGLKTVEMSFYNGWLHKNISILFDFQNNKTNNDSYMFYTATDFTFLVDFTRNDSENIKNVIVHVTTSNGKIVSLVTKYDAVKNKWIVKAPFKGSELPINLSVTFDAYTEPEFDERIVEDFDTRIKDEVKNANDEGDSIVRIMWEIINESKKETPNDDVIFHLEDDLRKISGITPEEEKHNKEIADDIYRRWIEICPEDETGDPNPETDRKFEDFIVSEMEKINPKIEQDHKTVVDFINDIVNGNPILRKGEYHIPGSGNMPDITIIKKGDDVYNPADLFDKKDRWNLSEEESNNGDIVFKNERTDDRVKVSNVPSHIPDGDASEQEKNNFYKSIDDFVNSYGWGNERDLAMGLTGNILDELSKGWQKNFEVAKNLGKNFKNADRIARVGEIADKYGKMLKAANVTSNIFAGIGAFTGGWTVGTDYLHIRDNGEKWKQIMEAVSRHCNAEAASSINKEAKKYKGMYDRRAWTKLLGDASLTGVGIASVEASGMTFGTSLLLTGGCYLSSKGLDYWDKCFTEDNKRHQGDIRDLVNSNSGCTPILEWDPDAPLFPPLVPIHDPSGFVYEGVFSNRLEGVTATAYYKEMVEDMYGDLHENIVKWDAEEYAQENPLFTDENGYYRWDVPQGMWQVKFEKEGYETTYSDWLPVPPPQLDVNIAMKQNVQPNVKNARAYEDAVEVEFDKYMMPELLNTDNIIVMAGGKQVEGSVELLNEEVKYEGETETFASKLRFNASAPFEGTEVMLMVNNRVKSYAGIRMQDNYSQSFTIEQEIRKIVCDSATVVRYGDNGFIPVTVLPASASAGKTINVRNSSAMILGTDATSVVLDEEGKAMISVSGELPGTAALTFSVDGYDITATTIINVEMKQDIEISAPVASIASGTTVEKGTAITLTCATKDAMIYYTTDGSCPCDEGSRIKYTEPIIIDKTMTIKAMAIDSDGNESDVVELSYVVDETNGIEDINIDGNLKIYPLPVRDKLNVNAGGKIIKSVTLTNMNGSSVVESLKPVTIVTIDVSSLTPGIYIINVATEDKTYSHKIIKIE